MDDCSKSDRTICFCHSVKLSEIQAAIAQGATTLAQIQAETLASTGCGGCECDILDLIENTSAPRASTIAPSPKL